MINDTDIQLSKMSFTDKDFASLYPDLLDLAKQLTNEWDPGQATNESDPGVVLLKEGAFIADHNNYNIDKNILEAFLPSATQDKSVRNITEMNGYTPRYYVSATGKVTFNYNPETEEDFQPFTIPAYTIVVTDKDGNYAFTQAEDLTINKNNIASSCLFIEGTLNTLTINGEDTILLDNLDDNNRLYLPNRYIAQNGIYIINKTQSGQDNWSTSELWKKNNYLLTQPLGSKIYRFDYDSSVSLPYIEFPSDIANIIGNGLKIRYLSSTGTLGNIPTNTLTNITTPDTFKSETFGVEISMSDFELSNQSSFENGKNPETIDEMYRSFKKIVGTFDTLVTCKDYSNAIYSLEDEYNNPIISNGVVTDIRDDYNHALKVITYDKYGEYFENISLGSANSITKYNFVNAESSGYTPTKGDIKFESPYFKVYDGSSWSVITSLSYNDFVDAAETMTQYDLYIYALQAFSMADYLDEKPWAALDKSFTPVTTATVNKIKNELHEFKCISHEFKDPTSDDVYCFKNYAPLNVIVTPYSKVNLKIKNEIVQNIYKAITKNFNARMIDFGEELNYDEVVKVLLNSDDRIKNIRLEDFDYIPKAVKVNNIGEVVETEVYQSQELLIDMIAKNVLAGRLCLFNFDDDFSYRFGQEELNVYDDIIEIETESVISMNTNPESETIESSTGNSVRFNEAVKLQIIGDWPSGVSITIPANGSYTLPNDSFTSGSVTINVESDASTGSVSRSYTPITTKTYSLKNLSSSDVTLADQTAVAVFATNQLEISELIVTSNSVSTNLNYTVRENEYIQIAYPNYYSTTIYPTYVYYYFEGPDQAENTGIIAYADAEYTLQSGEQIVFIYKSDNVQKVDYYNAGTTIRPNFDLKYTINTTGTGVNKTWSYTGIDSRTDRFMSLSASQQIAIRDILETQLTSVSTPCYWIMNNTGNILFNEDETTLILNSGEYFIYSNNTYDGMVILGAGTKLTRSDSDLSQWAIGSSNVSMYSINNNGYEADIKWQLKDFSNGKTFKIQEMNIITLGNGDSITIQGINTGDSSYSGDIDNTWNILPQGSGFKIQYSINGASATLNYSSAYDYLIRSRLDITIDSLNDQVLLNGQTVKIVTSKSSEPIEIETGVGENTFIQASVPLDITGSDSISMEAYNSNDVIVNLMSYSVKSPTLITYDFTLIPDTTTRNQISTNYLAQNKKVYCLTASGIYLEVTRSNLNDLMATSSTTIAQTGLTFYTAEPNVEPIEENNGKYVFLVSGGSGYAEFPLGYNVTFDSLSEEYKEYILPLFLLKESTGADITVSIKDEDDNIIKVKDYNYTEPANSITLNDEYMYLLSPSITNPYAESSESSEQDNSTTIIKNLTVTVSWNTMPVGSEIVTLLNPVVINGINENMGDISLTQVLNRITELISNSNKPNVKPYYIHKPSNDLAIQDENIMNPNILWDKNNVANIITIPQIDISNSSIEIAKSMRNYADADSKNRGAYNW